MAATKLKNLPSNGLTGSWKFSVSDRGFMTAETYLEVLADVDDYLSQNEISRPVVMVIDGYPGIYPILILVNLSNQS